MFRSFVGLAIAPSSSSCTQPYFTTAVIVQPPSYISSPEQVNNNGSMEFQLRDVVRFVGLRRSYLDGPEVPFDHGSPTKLKLSIILPSSIQLTLPIVLHVSIRLLAARQEDNGRHTKLSFIPSEYVCFTVIYILPPINRKGFR
jgi:hypothetical protein